MGEASQHMQHTAKLMKLCQATLALLGGAAAHCINEVPTKSGKCLKWRGQEQ